MRKFCLIFGLMCCLLLSSCNTYGQSFGITYTWRGLEVVYVSDIPYVYYFDDYGYRHRQPIPREHRGEVYRIERPRPGYNPPFKPDFRHSGRFESSTRITGRSGREMRPQGNFQGRREPEGHRR